MRAILIDPETRTVKEIEVNGDLPSVHEALGVDCIDSAATGWLGEGVLYVDDEGLQKPGTKVFDVGAHQPFAGRGLFMGFDPATGEERSTDLPIEKARAVVTWPDLVVAPLDVADAPGFEMNDGGYGPDADPTDPDEPETP